MRSIVTKIVTFSANEIDKMRDNLMHWSLDGWEVKCCWQKTERVLDKATMVFHDSDKWVHFVLQKELTPGDNTPPDPRQRTLPSFETVGKDEE